MYHIINANCTWTYVPYLTLWDKISQNLTNLKGKQGWAVKTRGENRPGQYSHSGQYWSIEILSGQLNIFSGQLEIMVVSWLIDYGRLQA